MINVIAFQVGGFLGIMPKGQITQCCETDASLVSLAKTKQTIESV